MNKGKVLVTGCAGFVGSHLSESLLSRGYTVIGIDSFTPYYSLKIKRQNLLGALSNRAFQLIEQDIVSMSFSDLVSIMRNVDYVVHEAAQPGVRSSWGYSFDEYLKNNVTSTHRLLEVATKLRSIRKFVYASSSSVYGNASKVPTKEDCELKPCSPYGVTKLTAESLCYTYYENFSVPVLVLRYFTVYGPRQRPDMAFHKFIKSMVLGEPLTLYGDGSQLRDFTYVQDVVDATIKAMESSDETNGQAINIGSSSPIKLVDCIKILSELLRVEPDIIFSKEQKGEMKATYADITKAKELLDWSPQARLREGLEKQINWVKEAIKQRLLLDSER